MKVGLDGGVLRIREIKELGAGNSDVFRRRVRAAWPTSALTAIEIDLSETHSLDSCGLAALIALQKWAASHNANGAVPVRLLNPPPTVQQILELTRLHRTFEIVKPDP
jgi:anti-sigma B factor antagonist